MRHSVTAPARVRMADELPIRFAAGSIPDTLSTMTGSVPVLVVTGPIGAGKTTIVSEIGEILERVGVAHATCDFDALTQVWPPPAGDRFNLDLGTRNLECFWANCAKAGARCLVLGMTVETRTERDAIKKAIPSAEPAFVRLTASLQELERRIRAREVGSARDWHLRRTHELVAVMEMNNFEPSPAVVPTDARPVEEIALDVLAAAGWDHLIPGCPEGHD